MWGLSLWRWKGMMNNCCEQRSKLSYSSTQCHHRYTVVVISQCHSFQHKDFLRPLAQNLRVYNTNSTCNTSTLAGHPLLQCLFRGCNQKFKLRFTLSRHKWTSQWPDASSLCPSSDTSPQPGEYGEHQFHCTFAGCLCFFNNKGNCLVYVYKKFVFKH